MTYVMSDIHGEYEKYRAMLEKINFGEGDILYVLGDVVDRGQRPVDVLLDMMARPNVYPIIGNHELMAANVLRALCVEITEQNYASHIDEGLLDLLMQWQFNGGQTTIKQFQKLPLDKREYVLEYFEEFVPYELVKVGNKRFLLVHSGLGNFDKEKELDDYTLEELTFMRPEFDRRYFEDDDLYIVSGHTPTLAINGKPEIYKSQNNIFIDCGATFTGKLACLCLDTMDEFYI